jgi:hypothetical protein
MLILTKVANRGIGRSVCRKGACRGSSRADTVSAFGALRVSPDPCTLRAPSSFYGALWTPSKSAAAEGRGIDAP